MDDATPTPLPEDIDATPDRVPDPHRGEPLPPAQAGVRPEAAASGVRPEQDEPGGPLPGLVTAASAEVEEELTDDPSAEALLAQMGVEDEGIESGQLIGIMAAILFAVAALAFGLIYLFIIPLQQQTVDEAEGVALYPELESTENAGLSQLRDYRTVEGGYGIPIERAMGIVAAQYDGSGDSLLSGEALPTSRQGMNTAWIDLNADGAVQETTARGELATGPDDASSALDPAVGVTNESVGVDDVDDVTPRE